MRAIPQIERPASEDFALACGLLRAHVIEGVPLARLAADFGYSVPRLRASLTAHLATCTAALGIEPPTAPVPEIAPEVPPATPPETALELPQVRIRERVPRPA